MSNTSAGTEATWYMQKPREGSQGRPGEAHLLASNLAVSAAIGRLEHISFMLRMAPQDSVTVDHLLRLTGVYWSEAASHYEAFKQISNCEGEA